MRRIACLFALAPVPAAAEDGKLDVSLEVRVRVEALDGQFRPAPAAREDGALLIRTNLFAEYDAGPVRLGGELVDARAYLQPRGSAVSTSEVNALEPIQAYVATDFSEMVRMRAGRFTLNLGSRRLVSRNAFRNTINAFTGLRADLGDADAGATLFATVAQARLPSDADGISDNAVELDRERGGVRLFGAFAHREERGLVTEVTLVRLAESDARRIATRDRRLWTLAGRSFRAPAAGRLDHDVEAAAQWGTTRLSTAAADRDDRPVRAGFVHAAVGYTLAAAWRPRLSLAFDAATGDGPGRTFRRYDPLFSSRVFDFGPTSLYGPLTRANLVAVDVAVDVRPDDATDARLGVKPTWLAARADAFAQTGVRDPAGAAGRHAGTQLDLRLRHTLVADRLRLGAGIAYLAKGGFLRDAANAPAPGDTRFAWAELTATF